MNTPKLPPLPEPDMYADPCDANGMPTEYYTEATVMRLLADAIAAQGVPDKWLNILKEVEWRAGDSDLNGDYEGKCPCCGNWESEGHESACDLADALASAPPAPQAAVVQQEPVAWRTFDGEGGYEYRAFDHNEDYAAEWAKRNPKHSGWVEALYTHPAKQAKPQPLSDEQRSAIVAKWKGGNWTAGDIIDAVEAAHGIKE